MREVRRARDENVGKKSQNKTLFRLTGMWVKPASVVDQIGVRNRSDAFWLRSTGNLWGWEFNLMLLTFKQH